MASLLSAILTSHALWNYSKISHEREPANLSLVFIASSNRHQTESTPHLLDYMEARAFASGLLVRFDHVARFIVNANHSIM